MSNDYFAHKAQSNEQNSDRVEDTGVFHFGFEQEAIAAAARVNQSGTLGSWSGETVLLVNKTEYL